jgi:penicillin-binding protein 2
MSFSEFEIKKYIFYSTVILLFLVLLIRFYRLQISEVSLYSEKSLENSVKMISQTPVRGNIYDRNGKLIVDNRPAFSLYLVPAETNSQTIRAISTLSGIPEEDIYSELKDAGKFQSVKVVRQIDLKKLTWIQENISDLPGVEWKTEPKRHYIRTSGLAHLLGTLGEVDEDEVEKFNQVEPGDIIGKKAIERTYDMQIRGVKGFDYVKVDALGRVVDKVPTEKTTLPYPGKELYLTIDLRLQAYADSLMEGKRGAVIAIDPRNGQILTLLSKPDYDISKFTGVIPMDLWETLVNNEFHPLYDRACQSGYPPGSTYKLVAAIAALNENIITPRWSSNCPGYFKLGRRTIKCWKAGGHGTLDLEGAIKNSCNVYFYKLGLLIGLDVWSKYSRLFHFGEKTNIELTNENPGLVPSLEYYNKVYGEGKWTKGMLANLAIGQGELLVTPLQMAQFASILANHGEFYRPHLGYKLCDIIKEDTTVIKTEKVEVKGVRESVFKIILEGMREVVDGGTGWLSGIYGIPSAGKTGTAQNPHGKDHAWFIGFAPFENPEIAICVLVENGGSGGGVSAPIAGAFLKRYFYYQGKYNYALERRMRAIAAAKRDSLAAAADSLNQETSAVPDTVDMN